MHLFGKQINNKWGQHLLGHCMISCLCFLTEGLFGGTPVNLLVSSQKCQGVPFSPF